jgi:hypothetical protein
VGERTLSTVSGAEVYSRVIIDFVGAVASPGYMPQRFVLPMWIGSSCSFDYLKPACRYPSWGSCFVQLLLR